MEKSELSLIIEHPANFLIVLLGLGLFIIVVSVYVPNPLDKIGSLITILKNEANPNTNKSSVK